MPARKPLGSRPSSPVAEAFSSARAEPTVAAAPAGTRKRRFRKVGEGQKRSKTRKRAMQVLKKYGYNLDLAIQNAGVPEVKRFLQNRREIGKRKAVYDRASEELSKHTESWGTPNYGAAINSLKARKDYEAAAVLAAMKGKRK